MMTIANIMFQDVFDPLTLNMMHSLKNPHKFLLNVFSFRMLFAGLFQRCLTTFWGNPLYLLADSKSAACICDVVHSLNAVVHVQQS